MRYHKVCAAFFFLALMLLPVGRPAAQETSGSFTGGSVKIGYDSRTCDRSLKGSIRFDSSTACAEFCDGSNWICPTGIPVGWFVQSAGAYNGNLGGLSGANSTCLTDLTNNDWTGKSDAGTLTSSRVHAFLCDNSTCNNLDPNTAYIMARSGSATAGGMAFLTNSSGLGPGNATDWAAVGFDAGSHDAWYNRGTVSATYWANTPKGTNSCNNWTDGTSSKQGRLANAGWTTAKRWDEANNNCNTTQYLICFVDPL